MHQVWLNPLSRVLWREIEMSLADKYRLQDILFSGLNNKQRMQAFGPIIANTIVNFKLMEKCIQHSHNNVYIYIYIYVYNNDICSGGAQFFQPDLMKVRINSTPNKN